jgi:hypothetical protein
MTKGIAKKEYIKIVAFVKYDLTSFSSFLDANILSK